MFAAGSGSTMMPLRAQHPFSERRWRRWRVVVALAAFVALWLACPPPAAGQSSEADVRRVASQLRCVVCDHQSVAESNAELAAQMRDVIREQQAAGRTDREIIQFFVERYGDTILYAPPRRGFSLLAWWMPVVVLLVGAAGAVGFWRQRRRSRPAQPSAAALSASPQEAAPDDLPDLSDADVAHYRQRLAQELAVEPRDPPDRTR
ncbi:MAG: cytochrome c-type biogenesis protein CcmH [Chloroflexota bacterium]|nr:cytochrome c-type biogenesis protein CcmH [Chloroflexota bacterium]